ncbi:MAG: hypothetical protein RH948_03105 [Cyclobacteriaceae bacterium]
MSIKGETKMLEADSDQFAFSLSTRFHRIGFSKAIEIDKRKNPLLLVPATVNFSYSIELMLKLLLRIDYGDRFKSSTHDLEKLYSFLRKDIEKMVRFSYNQNRQKAENRDLKTWAHVQLITKSNHQTIALDNVEAMGLDKIKNLLAFHKASFVNWRYIFRLKKDSGYFNVFDFCAMNDFYNALRLTVLELKKSEWHNFIESGLSD